MKHLADVPLFFAGQPNENPLENNLLQEYDRLTRSPVHIQHLMRFHFLCNNFLPRTEEDYFEGFHDFYKVEIEGFHDISTEQETKDFERMFELFFKSCWTKKFADLESIYYFYLTCFMYLRKGKPDWTMLEFHFDSAPDLMDQDWCIQALKDWLVKYEKPELFLKGILYMSIREMQIFEKHIGGKSIREDIRLDPKPTKKQISKLNDVPFEYMQYCREFIFETASLLAYWLEQNVDPLILNLVMASGYPHSEFLVDYQNAWEGREQWAHAMKLLSQISIDNDSRTLSECIDYLQDLFHEDFVRTGMKMTARSLIRRSTEWHDRFGLNFDYSDLPLDRTFSRLGMDDFEHKNQMLKLTVKFELLTTQQDLNEESQVLRHCVATYGERCWLTALRIWRISIFPEDRDHDPFHDRLTMSVDEGHITEVSGYKNRPPSNQDRDFVRLFAFKYGLEIGSRDPF